MKKNKLYLLIILLLVVIFFATATFCNRCAASEEEKTGAEAEEDGKAEESEQEGAKAVEKVQDVEGEHSGGSEVEETEEENGEEEIQSAKEAPTINIEVYEGPLYSQSDDVCFWRIKATVTGSPTPSVEFSKDDSNGAWGSRKAQVNIGDPSESSILIATATNSEGTATNSMVLTWECNRNPQVSEIVTMGDHFTGVEYVVSASVSDPDGDSLSYVWAVNGGSLDSVSGNPVKWTMPSTAGNFQITVKVDDGKGGTASMTETVEVLDLLGPPLAAMEIPIVVMEGGRMTSDENIWVGNVYQVGDTSTNLGLRGYVSFDITGLSGAIVESAQLDVNHSAILSNCDLFRPLWVTSVNWEPGHIANGDFDLSGDPIASFHSPDFSTDTDKLRIYLQNAIDSGRDRFQLMFLFTGMLSDGDGTFDCWGYSDSGIKLNIIYHN